MSRARATGCAACSPSRSRLRRRPAGDRLPPPRRGDAMTHHRQRRLEREGGRTERHQWRRHDRGGRRGGGVVSHGHDARSQVLVGHDPGRRPRDIHHDDGTHRLAGQPARDLQGRQRRRARQRRPRDQDHGHSAGRARRRRRPRRGHSRRRRQTAAREPAPGAITPPRTFTAAVRARVRARVMTVSAMMEPHEVVRGRRRDRER